MIIHSESSNIITECYIYPRMSIIQRKRRERQLVDLHFLLSAYFRQKKKKRNMSTNRLTTFNKRTMPLNNNNGHSISKLI